MSAEVDPTTVELPIEGVEPIFRHMDDDDMPWQLCRAQRNADGTESYVREKWFAFSPDPQYLSLYAEYDPGMMVRRHGHYSPHIVFVIDGGLWFGDRWCPKGSHIELPFGAAFGPIRAGDEGAKLYEVMIGRPPFVGRPAGGLRGGAGRAGRHPAARPAARVPGVALRPAPAVGRRRRLTSALSLPNWW